MMDEVRGGRHVDDPVKMAGYLFKELLIKITAMIMTNVTIAMC